MRIARSSAACTCASLSTSSALVACPRPCTQNDHTCFLHSVWHCVGMGELACQHVFLTVKLKTITLTQDGLVRKHRLLHIPSQVHAHSN